jgi:hypothetical protein
MIKKIEKIELKESLKEQIFKKEKKVDYSSEKFKKIEIKVRDSLKIQKADEALKDITI